MTGVVGSLLEAWGEVRVHRARVVLSLVGVVLAVFAMTAVTGVGMLMRQVVQESAERAGGRDATLTVSVYGEDGTARPEQLTAFLDSLVERYQVRYSSRVTHSQLPVAPDAASEGMVPSVTLVDPDYAVIHRITPTSGRWLVASDADRLAVPIVVNSVFVEGMGMVGREPPFTVPLAGTGTTAMVVGVVDRDQWGPTLFMLVDDAAAVVPPGQQMSPTLELWVPPEQAEVLQDEVKRLIHAEDLAGEAYPMSDPSLGTVLTAIQWVIFGLSVFALFLGTLGVLNVGVVTVRHRIREIGVRRALGASSGRIFAAIMLESVLATALAGVVGIALAVALVNNLPLQLLPAELAVTDDLPFPAAAAVQAFLAATAVGALAGLVPATIAVRSRVIDAIRY